jgi:hypothetical protein
VRFLSGLFIWEVCADCDASAASQNGRLLASKLTKISETLQIAKNCPDEYSLGRR